ncbi:Subunit of heteropentameric Replication factor C (RF-C) [Batrachochytrium dendrobatidis]
MSDLVDRSPWTERYRPKTLSEISGQNEVVAVLSNTIQTQNLPHLLLYGPPGTGKTSIILALARQLYGANGLKGRLLELNASDERGIDVIREKVKNFAKITVSAAHSNAPPYKIIVLDEADSLTTDAQSALRRIMENYSKITRFCLICNYVSRIIDPLASRCAKLRFKPIPMPIVIERLELICSNEKLSFAPGALDFLATSCAGDLRKAITLLQSIKKVSIGSTVTKNHS